MKIINYKNIEWIVLKENDQVKTLITKDVLPISIMKELTDNDSCYCKFDDETNEYENSYIRTILNKFVDKYLDKSDLQQFSNEDYVRLLNAKEVLQYDKELMCCNEWYWTKTKVKGTGSLVWTVNLYGSLFNFNANIGDHGVRPVICLKSKSLEEDKKMKKLDYDEIRDNLADKIPNDFYIAEMVNKLIDKVNKLEEERND